MSPRLTQDLSDLHTRVLEIDSSLFKRRSGGNKLRNLFGVSLVYLPVTEVCGSFGSITGV